MKIEKQFQRYFYPFIASISSVILISTNLQLVKIARSLENISEYSIPVSDWAAKQNECITKTFRLDGKNTQGIPSKVWSCNGGGDW